LKLQNVLLVVTSDIARFGWLQLDWLFI